MVTLFPSQVTSLLFFSIMQDYFERIEEKDQICTRKTETPHSNATYSKGIFGWKLTKHFKAKLNTSSFRL